MSQQMKEPHGNTADLSCVNEKKPLESESSLQKDSLFLKTVLYVITTPGCVVFMGISWFHLYSLCRFGRLHKNIPILLLCLLWWIGAVIYGLKLWSAYKRNGRMILFTDLVIEDREMLLKGDFGCNMDRIAIGNYEQTVNNGQASEENTEQISTVTESFSEKQIKWFIRKQDIFRFFLKDKRVLTLTLNGQDKKTRDFLMLKLSAVSFFGKRCWRILACILLVVMTVLGAGAVVKSAMPWQGKLGSYLQMQQDKRTVKLVHDNVYAYGIEGLFSDIRDEIDLPETLCLSTSFNMHFAPDGKILSLDTMLYGFDEYGNFVDSYLISYTSSRSSKIAVYLHGSGGGIYKEDKDLAPLIEAVSLIPLKQKVRQWEGEECYGILYYGKREWRDRAGIRILNADGTESLPPDSDYYFYGYSISLFCPDNERLTPLRYLYPDYRNFPIVEKAESYPADYVPEGSEENDPSRDLYVTEENATYFDGSSVHETGNIRSRNVNTDPANQFYFERGSSTQEIAETYTDVNGEQIYEYSYEGFRMADVFSGADTVNAFLARKQGETLAEWKKRGSYLSENVTAAEEYPWNNTPSDTIEFVAVSYYSDRYCSLVFDELHYTGGVRAEYNLLSYTIDLRNGEEIQLTGFAGLTKEEWIEQINTAFAKEQGFYTLYGGTEYEETAGENWYESYEKGGWGSGFYFSDEGVVVYYGLGQITIQQKGVIETVIPWDEINRIREPVDLYKIYEYRIPEQSFDVSLNGWGEVTFVSCMPMSNSGIHTNPLADVSFYLLSGNRILYRFPYVNVIENDIYTKEDNIRSGGSVDEIAFVMFTDVNGDARDDVVIGILYETGAGPQGAIPRMEVRIYEDQGDKFVYDAELSDECDGLPYDTTAAEVKAMIEEHYAQ